MKTSCEESFLQLIGHTGRAIRSYADQRLKCYDLTVEQLQVLKEAASGGGETPNTLGLLTGKSPANMTRILDRLEKKNIIVRKSNPDDRRSSLVFLTNEGKALFEEVKTVFAELRSELVAGIEGDKQVAAVEVLMAIKNNVRLRHKTV